MSKVNLVMIICIIMLAGCSVQKGQIYTPEDVVEICGFGKERSREFTVAGVDSVNVMPTKSSVDEHFDEMDFYIFESERDAKKAFKGTDYWFEDIEEEGDDFRKGWIAGVSDAYVEKYEYLTGNMIILTETQVVSAWAEPIEPADEGDPAAGGGEGSAAGDKTEMKEANEEEVDRWSQSYRDEVVELMRETFR